MSAWPSSAKLSAQANRWFYCLTSLCLLAIMFLGFHLFYLQGQAYPGRPITPPIRTLVVAHGLLMTAWMLLAVVQPLLVATRHQRLHRKLGVVGVLLATAMVVSGLHIGVESARVSPPEMRVFGLDPQQFLAVPVWSILIFGLFVMIGVLNRRRPDVHRPMMLMASVSVIGAALGRITLLNQLYAGTWWEVVLSAFFMQVILAALLLVVKCLVFRSFDRWLALGVGAFSTACVLISLGARTQAWNTLASFLLR
jgi:small basic protein